MLRISKRLAELENRLTPAGSNCTYYEDRDQPGIYHRAGTGRLRRADELSADAASAQSILIIHQPDSEPPAVRCAGFTILIPDNGRDDLEALYG